MTFLFMAGVGSEALIILVPILTAVFFLARGILRRKSKSLSIAQINIIAMIITIITSPVVAAILIGLIIGTVMVFN